MLASSTSILACQYLLLNCFKKQSHAPPTLSALPLPIKLIKPFNFRVHKTSSNPGALGPWSHVGPGARWEAHYQDEVKQSHAGRGTWAEDSQSRKWKFAWSQRLSRATRTRPVVVELRGGAVVELGGCGMRSGKLHI